MFAAAKETEPSVGLQKFTVTSGCSENCKSLRLAYFATTDWIDVSESDFKLLPAPATEHKNYFLPGPLYGTH